jgi:hypothetical protein
MEVLTWLYAPQSLAFGQHNGFNMIPESYFRNLDSVQHPMPQSFTPLTKLFCFAVSMIPTSITLIMLYFLIKLFRLYQQGDIFTSMNVRYIRNVGYALLVGQLIKPVYQGLIGLALTWQNAPGHRFAMFVLGTDDFGVILTALLIILVSWIMAEGCKLREDQQLTI